jgi:hypothetical protein
LLERQEAICLALGHKSGLGYCYWNWGVVERDRGNSAVELEKLEAALRIFTELKMPQERDSIQSAVARALGTTPA